MGRRKRAPKAGKEPRRNESLPYDVLESILLRLPPEGLGSARCVCSEWNLAIGSKSFQARKAELDHETGRIPKPYLAALMGHGKKRWLHVLDPSTGMRHDFVFPTAVKGSFKLAFVVGGLVFIFREGYPVFARMCAWNPLTGLVKEFCVFHLTYFVVHSTHITHIFYKHYSRHLPLMENETVFLQETERHWNQVDCGIIYKSSPVTRKWQTLHDYVYKDGYRISLNNRRSKLEATHVVNTRRLVMPLPWEIASARANCKLVEHKTSLLLVAVPREKTRATRLVVWKLEGRLPSRWEWTFGTEMPPQLLEVLFDGRAVGSRSWKCNVVGDLVIISTAHSRGREEVVVFLDMTDLSWRRYYPYNDRVQHPKFKCFWTDPRTISLTFAPFKIKYLPAD